MQTLTKKTTILFSPKMYHRLAHLAKQQGMSVAHLVRQAAIQCYLVPDRRTRLEAVEALSAMELPVADWPKMEKEIVQGALGHS
ncbi:MAG: hypothetical protein HYY59_06510 [Candidatus Omnitrophica bacterium]|nr:hypothetical protein [Candidatus Omnitrophota bacterium]